MIELTQGDILKADTEALVNTVNCVGIMGRGIALQFSKAFPANSRAYEAACRHGEFQPGRMFVFDTHQLTLPKYIINFPTKRHWKGKSRLADIESGLVSLVAEIKRLRIRSIAVPPLGCGLGGLRWNQVRPLIEKALAAVPQVQVQLFEPAAERKPETAVEPARVPKMTPGRAVLVGLMQRYLAGLMEPFVSLLEVHKLMYFVQEAGEPLRLRYKKAPYGPYAENLRQVLSRIEGHLISGFSDGVDDPDKRLIPIPEAINDIDRYLADHPETQSRFDRVVDLVQGFETPFGLELLSTVHWVATREGAQTGDQAVLSTYAWNQRKRRFSQDQIRLAREVLLSKGWLHDPTAPRMS